MLVMFKGHRGLEPCRHRDLHPLFPCRLGMGIRNRIRIGISYPDLKEYSFIWKITKLLPHHLFYSQSWDPGFRRKTIPEQLGESSIWSLQLLIWWDCSAILWALVDSQFLCDPWYQLPSLLQHIHTTSIYFVFSPSVSWENSLCSWECRWGRVNSMGKDGTLPPPIGWARKGWQAEEGALHRAPCSWHSLAEM